MFVWKKLVESHIQTANLLLSWVRQVKEEETVVVWEED